MKKVLVVGIIVLFLSVSVTPSIGISNNEDTTPPVTTHSFNGIEGENGFYISDVEVTLNATDDMSGVNITYYELDMGEEVIYSEPFMIIGHGWHVLLYRSIDNAGNEESWKCEYIEIDLIPPEIELHWTKLENKSIKFEPYLYDEGSGFYKVEFLIDNISMYTAYGGDMFEWIWTPNSSGWHLASGIVYDKAGHSTRDDILININSYNTMVKESNQINLKIKLINMYYLFLEQFPLLERLLNVLRWNIE